MQRSISRRVAVAVGAVALWAGSASAAVVFSDNLAGGSTLNAGSPAAPTSTSTNYAMASTKNSLSSTSLTSGQLKLGMTATTSGLIEAQALFTSSPVVLAADGDYIELQVTFTNLANILSTTNTSSINMGLYNSHGSSPVAGSVLSNSGLSATTGSIYDTGYVAGWEGYNGRILSGTTNGTRLFTRPNQNGLDTASESQDLLFDNVGGGAFDDPTGVVIGSQTAAGLTLTTSNQYTYVLRLTLNSGTGFVTAKQDIYSGAGTGGTNLFTQNGTTSVASTPTLQFDGLAIGYRLADATGTPAATSPSAMGINSVTVIQGSVPEPASLGLLGLAMIGMLRRRS